MTWLSLISDLVKGGLLFLAYTLGLKSEKTEIEDKATQKALDEATTALQKQEKIKAKYDVLKDNLPNTWAGIARMRAGKGSVPKADQAAVRSSGKSV